MATAPDLAELLRQLAALADDADAGPLRVVIERGGRRVELTAGAATDARPTTTPAVLNDLESNVLEAVAAGGRLADEIGKAAGYPNDPAFRTALAAMRRRGLLSGGVGERGYGLTDAGRAALTDRGR